MNIKYSRVQTQKYTSGLGRGFKILLFSSQNWQILVFAGKGDYFVVENYQFSATFVTQVSVELAFLLVCQAETRVIGGRPFFCCPPLSRDWNVTINFIKAVIELLWRVLGPL